MHSFYLLISIPFGTSTNECYYRVFAAIVRFYYVHVKHVYVYIRCQTLYNTEHLPSNGFAVMGKKKKEIYSTKSGNWPNSAGVDHKLIQKIMTTISMIDASGY